LVAWSSAVLHLVARSSAVFQVLLLLLMSIEQLFFRQSQQNFCIGSIRGTNENFEESL
jgi:hypothetical protein